METTTFSPTQQQNGSKNNNLPTPTSSIDRPTTKRQRQRRRRKKQIDHDVYTQTDAEATTSALINGDIPESVDEDQTTQIRSSALLVTTVADVHQQREMKSASNSPPAPPPSVEPTSISSTLNQNEAVKTDSIFYNWHRRRQGLRRFSGQRAVDDSNVAVLQSSSSSLSMRTTPPICREPISADFHSKRQENHQTAATPLSRLNSNRVDSSSSMVVPLCNFHCQQIMHENHQNRSLSDNEDEEEDADYSNHKHYADFGHSKSCFVLKEQSQPIGFKAAVTTNFSVDADYNIAERYCYLMTKANLSWKRLRQLPLATPAAVWHQMFLRCFEIFNWLWKTQHMHRDKLYAELGISRWQIGELAQKIAQLYFNFYVRTSETDFLLQAFKFYNAIRERDYFESRPTSLSRRQQPLQSKQQLKILRYLCRLIVTSVLIKKMRLARQVINELAYLIDLYCTSAADDREKQNFMKWHKILENLLKFLQNDQLINVFPDSTTEKNGLPSNSSHHHHHHLLTNNNNHHHHYSVVLRNRLIYANSAPQNHYISNGKIELLNGEKSENQQTSTFFIEQAVICGNTNGQIQFGDLQVDMYRFMQALEWETSESAANLQILQSSSRSSTLTTSTSNHSRMNGGLDDDNNNEDEQNSSHSSSANSLWGCGRHIRVRAAPRKYMLLQPSFSTFMSTMTHAFNELTITSGILLLYFSCDSAANNLLLGSETVFPSDLTPFLRKPLLLIVDSSASESFRRHLLKQQKIDSNFFALLAPTQVPDAVAARLSGTNHVPNQYGRLLTLFLFSPCTALCIMLDKSHESCSVPLERWMAALSCLHEALELLAKVFDIQKITEVQRNTYQDTFGRMLVLRFVFMQYVYQMYGGSFKREDGAGPTCVPSLPGCLYDRDDVEQRIRDCARELGFG